MKISLIRFVGYLVPLACILAIADCGGGGGGDDFIGAAQVSISAAPTQIDTGDRTLIKVNISEVHENGIALKLRFPTGLFYVLNSSFVTVNGADVNTGPAVSTGAGNYNYLVFYFPQSVFGRDSQGDLTVQLEGNSEVIDGRVEVDADVDDPLIDNAVEFDPDNPEFEAEDSVSVQVRVD